MAISRWYASYLNPYFLQFTVGFQISNPFKHLNLNPILPQIEGRVIFDVTNPLMRRKSHQKSPRF